ncbi:hypothetical protein KMZ29_13660 [Bradyrhizobium sediminis]|uniref:Uncharacterized protein n=1 Tax=Bradyrhizobium sediminis TaxID=2840469 RepID=A0A975N984_9BRAD|nr:hypothetical protein [Bradyrhizobium sediminis]QWG10838.1 hypothetical protein KMZ29_13660 [Bradyrhizobium sediminis]
MRKLPHAAIPAAMFPIITDLPPSVYEGIGKVVSAHAFLETQVTELLFELSKIDYPIGRVTLKYQAASERFKTVKKLLVLHGFSPPELNLNELFKQIETCCRVRDELSHGVWVQTPQGKLALRLTKGDYETEDGIADRSFIPQANEIPDTHYDQARNIILLTANAVARLKAESTAFLKGQHAAAE